MSEYTPGPWWAFIGPAEEGPAVYYRGLVAMVANGPDRRIAVVTGNEGDKGAHPCEAGEWEANARLMAAAPDLLEALAAIMSRYQGLFGDNPPYLDACDLETIGRAYAALARAKGQQP